MDGNWRTKEEQDRVDAEHAALLRRRDEASSRPVQSLEFGACVKGARNAARLAPGEVIAVLENGKTVRIERGAKLPADFPNKNGYDCAVWECAVTDRGGFATARPLRKCPKWAAFYAACEAARSAPMPAHVPTIAHDAIRAARVATIQPPHGRKLPAMERVEAAMAILYRWLSDPASVTAKEMGDAEWACLSAKREVERAASRAVGGPAFNRIDSSGTVAIWTEQAAESAWRACGFAERILSGVIA
jgi:hypothetical protein